MSTPPSDGAEAPRAPSRVGAAEPGRNPRNPKIGSDSAPHRHSTSGPSSALNPASEEPARTRIAAGRPASASVHCTAASIGAAVRRGRSAACRSGDRPTLVRTSGNRGSNARVACLQPPDCDATGERSRTSPALGCGKRRCQGHVERSSLSWHGPACRRSPAQSGAPPSLPTSLRHQQPLEFL